MIRQALLHVGAPRDLRRLYGGDWFWVIGLGCTEEATIIFELCMIVFLTIMAGDASAASGPILSSPYMWALPAPQQVLPMRCYP